MGFIIMFTIISSVLSYSIKLQQAKLWPWLLSDSTGSFSHNQYSLENYLS